MPEKLYVPVYGAIIQCYAESRTYARRICHVKVKTSTEEDDTMSPAHSLVSHALAVGAIDLFEDVGIPTEPCPYTVHAKQLMESSASTPFLTRAYAACANTPGIVLFGMGERRGRFAEMVATMVELEYTIHIGHATDVAEDVVCVDAHGVHHNNLRGKRVMVLDDVDSNCRSILTSMLCVEENGGILIGITTLFDRQERTGPSSSSTLTELWADAFGVPVYAAASLHELVDVLTFDGGVRYPRGPDVLEAIRRRIGTHVRW